MAVGRQGALEDILVRGTEGVAAVAEEVMVSLRNSARSHSPRGRGDTEEVRLAEEACYPLLIPFDS